MHRRTTYSLLTILATLALPVSAQEATQPATEASAETAPEQQATETAENLLTQAQLEQLVAPIALYPDTLLVQLLVAATYPLQVVKADQAAQAAADLEEEARKEALEAQGFDPSVEVLAVAFPSVLERMADNIEWTETVGEAMLAQSDDVMDTIQLLRTQAIETGALIDTPEQEVTVQETLSTSGEPTSTVVVQPTNPEVVYVPQYDPVAVYDTSSGVDLWGAGLMGFATFMIVDAIFDDDDDWNDYWGCRHCGGWNGWPIVNDPDIDIDIDIGDVIAGNEIDRDTIRNKIEAGEITLPDGWKPDPGKRQEARDKIAERKGSESARPLPQPVDRGDAMREKLSERAGTADISRPENTGALRDAAVAAGAAGGAIAGREALKRASEHKDIPINRPTTAQKPPSRPQIDKPKVTRPAAKPATKPQVSRPAAKPAARPAAKPATRPAAKPATRPATKPKVSRPTSGHAKPAIKKQASGSRTKAASNRARAGKAKRR